MVEQPTNPQINPVVSASVTTVVRNIVLTSTFQFPQKMRRASYRATSTCVYRGVACGATHHFAVLTCSRVRFSVPPAFEDPFTPGSSPVSAPASAASAFARQTSAAPYLPWQQSNSPNPGDSRPNPPVPAV